MRQLLVGVFARMGTPVVFVVVVVVVVVVVLAAWSLSLLLVSFPKIS